MNEAALKAFAVTITEIFFPWNLHTVFAMKIPFCEQEFRIKPVCHQLSWCQDLTTTADTA